MREAASWLVKGLGAIGVLNQERKQRLSRIDPGILCWDLRHGIPFPDGTFDAVYHSHFLEHLDRSVAPAVLRECGRVLKPGGIVRVVIPDWEWLTNRYLEAVQAVNQRNSEARRRHETAMHDLIDQMVKILQLPYLHNRMSVSLLEKLRKLFGSRI